ncbi:hypothetical protein G5714_010157 [Onychostoma macrolepis]|uniref:Uncharacterized protein n=1 Tax=Onychostoma macrolepis TaxID=369639 RepID=A0A7J6CQ05_9TELE|nr:hypothetical protein G5714_010157 [Onychostoma macrolepis]
MHQPEPEGKRTELTLAPEEELQDESDQGSNNFMNYELFMSLILHGLCCSYCFPAVLYHTTKLIQSSNPTAAGCLQPCAISGEALL